MRDQATIDWIRFRIEQLQISKAQYEAQIAPILEVIQTSDYEISLLNKMLEGELDAY